MRLLRKKTEVKIGTALAAAVKIANRAVENAEWLSKLTTYQQEEITRLQAELNTWQGLDRWPMASTSVH